MSIPMVTKLTFGKLWEKMLKPTGLLESVLELSILTLTQKIRKLTMRLIFHTLTVTSVTMLWHGTSQELSLSTGSATTIRLKLVILKCLRNAKSLGK